MLKCLLFSSRLLLRSLYLFRSCYLLSLPLTKNMPHRPSIPTSQQTAQLATSPSRACQLVPPQTITQWLRVTTLTNKQASHSTRWVVFCHDICLAGNFNLKRETQISYKSKLIYLCFALVQISFPDCVRWTTIEFDPQCGTAQPEDTLRLLIPNRTLHLSSLGGKPLIHDTINTWTELRKFSGSTGWPTTVLVLPGKRF